MAGHDLTAKKWYRTLQGLKAILLNHIDTLNNEAFSIRRKIEDQLPLFLSIGSVFADCNFDAKQKLMRKVFEAGWVF